MYDGIPAGVGGVSTHLLLARIYIPFETEHARWGGGDQASFFFGYNRSLVETSNNVCVHVVYTRSTPHYLSVVGVPNWIERFCQHLFFCGKYYI